MRHTHSRAQRFGGHTKHRFYCSCGRQVSGNGGKQHFKLEGHKRIGLEEWQWKNGRLVVADVGGRRTGSDDTKGVPKRAADVLDEFLVARMEESFAEGDLANYQRWQFVRTLSKVAIKAAADG